MERMVYIWSDQDTVDDLKYKLLSINQDLESVREEVSKIEEIKKQLMHLVMVARGERDQMQNILKMFLPITAENETSPAFSDVINNDGYPILPRASNFSTDVISKTSSSNPAKYNFAADHSSNLGFFKSGAVQGCDVSPQVATMPSSNSKTIDDADVLIDNIVRTRPLPKRGRLFQAVMEIEPLLQTLLVAPLPNWKNPPPLSSSLTYGCDVFCSQGQVEAVNPIRAVQAGSSSLGFSQIPTPSMLNFGHGSTSMKTQVGNSSSDLMPSQIGSCKRRKTGF